jgi:hypothetical protein
MLNYGAITTGLTPLSTHASTPPLVSKSLVAASPPPNRPFFRPLTTSGPSLMNSSAYIAASSAKHKAAPPLPSWQLSTLQHHRTCLSIRSSAAGLQSTDYGPDDQHDNKP